MTTAVVGATGYVGRLLAAHLAQQGVAVVAIGRGVQPMKWPAGIEARPADVGDGDSISAALTGVEVAYYLVHSLAAGEGLSARDRDLAQSFAVAATQAGVQRVVYLGGLGHENLSEHLSSRQEVGEVLRRLGPPVVELRAAVILGAGSISFEMLRYLTERLPCMVCPRWVESRLQPLAQPDLLRFLEQAPTVAPGIYEIGSPDVTTYREMMDCYARIRGLRKRIIIKIPLLTPSLSARWVDFVTPVDKEVSHALIGSLANEVVVRDPSRSAAAFAIKPMTVAAGIEAALSDQAAELPRRIFDSRVELHDGIYTMRSCAAIPAGDADAVAADLARCGGDLQWYGAAWAWRLRIVLGWLFGERLRVRRPAQAAHGANADWWTIESLEPDRLVLGSLSWFFGDAWLGYLVERRAAIVQVASFRPKGVPGLLYWRLLRPIHGRVFHTMLQHRLQRARAHRP
jgi:uncharacterized protein YbjT (DUF2867 family)